MMIKKPAIKPFEEYSSKGFFLGESPRHDKGKYDIIFEMY